MASNTQSLTIRLGTAGLNRVRAAFRSISSSLTLVNRGLRVVTGTARTAGRALSTIGRGVSSVTRTMATAGAGIGLAAGAFTAFTRAGVESVAETARFARAVGMTTEEYTALRFAAQQTGLDVDALNGFLINLADKGFDAFNGAEGSAEQLADLGVSAVDAEGNLKPLNQLFMDLADSVASMPDGTKKTGALSIFAGDDGARAIDLLNLGSEAIARQGQEAERLGLVVSEAESDLAQSTKNSVEGLFASVRATRDAVALAFAPDIKSGAENFAEVLATNREEIVAFAKLSFDSTIRLIKDLYSVLSGKGQPRNNFLRENAQNIRDVVSALTGNVGAIQNPKILEARADLISFAEAGFEAVKAIGRTYEFLASVYSDFNAIISGEGSVDNGFMQENAQNIRDIMSALRGDREAIENGAIKAAYDIVVGLGNAVVVAALVIADMFNTIAGNTEADMFTDFGKIFQGMYTNFIKPTKDLVESAILGITELLGDSGAAWFAVGSFIFLLTQFNNIIQLIQTTVASVGAIKAFFTLVGSTAAWATFAANLAAMWASISAFGASAIAVLASPIVLAIGAIVVALGLLWYFWDDVVYWFGVGVEKLWSGLTWLSDWAMEWVKYFGDIIKNGVKAVLDPLLNFLGLKKDVSVEVTASGDDSLIGAPTVSRSAGGIIAGAGSGTSDSIIARVSNGEYVVRAAAVRRFGKGVLDSINAGVMPAFATGGLVGAMPAPRYAMADVAGMSPRDGGRPVVLNLPDGGQVKMRGDSDSIADLEKRLRRSATSKIAPKPRWNR